MRSEEEDLQVELEKGETTISDNDIPDEVLNELPPELQSKWADAPMEQLQEVIEKRKRVLDGWLERQKQIRAERETTI